MYIKSLSYKHNVTKYCLNGNRRDTKTKMMTDQPLHLRTGKWVHCSGKNNLLGGKVLIFLPKNPEK